MTKIALVRIGRCLRPHGLKGDILIHAFTEDPLALESYGAVYALPRDLADLVLESAPPQSFILQNIRPGPQHHSIIATFEGIITRTQVEDFLKVPVDLFIPRARLKDHTLKKDEFFHADLIGLVAYDSQGTQIGSVVAVHNFGAGDLLEIEHLPSASQSKKSPKTFLLPFRHAFVPDVDLQTGRLTIVYETDREATDSSSPHP
jgi:16S rRNA processing protein RimM